MVDAKVGASFCDQGWSPQEWGRRMDRRYQIQDRDTGQWRFFGDLFRQSVAQQRYAKVAIREIRRGGPVRIIVLKGRKAGISTVTGNLYYDITTHRQDTDSGVLAHNKASTDTLFRMVKEFWRRTPAVFRPEKKSLNHTRFEFGSRYMADLEEDELGIGSSYECQTAGADYPFTSGSIRLMHVSEMGKIHPGNLTKQVETMLSISNAVPSNGPSVLTMESTAQGWDNLFHRTWKQAEDNARNGRRPEPGEWIPVFVPWQDDHLNQMTPAPDFRWDMWAPEDVSREKDLIKRYWHGDFSIAAPYLRWRRFKLQESNMDYSKFDEEYPHSPEVAFLRGGRPAVPPLVMDYLQDLVCKPTASYSGSLEIFDEATGSKAISGW